MKEKVVISTAEVLRVYRLLEELNRFLHQPMHYDEHPAVVDWLKSGVYEELSSMYYEIVWGWPPKRRKGELRSSRVASWYRGSAPPPPTARRDLRLVPQGL
jgi:hypothetical protein